MIFPVLVFFLCATIIESSLNEGDSCSLNDSSLGICKSLSNCDSVYNKLLNGYLPDTVCKTSEWAEPVVCCPTNITMITSTPVTIRMADPGDGRGAIARQKCAEYAQYVFTLKAAPLGASVNVSQCAIKSQKLIVGGSKADRMEFPHMAAVGYNLTNGTIGWFCGGTLISENYVLTAAHCIYSQSGGDAAWVRVGDLNLVRTDDGASPVERRIVERIRYPDYSEILQIHDIALLRLESPVPFNAWIRPACLHTGASTGTEKTIVTGWGHVEWDADNGSSDLLKVTLPLVDYTTCNAKYVSMGSTKLPNGVVNDWMICAGKFGRDTCQGDSGGPLMIYSKQKYYCMYDVVGVTSLGQVCGSPIPGIYTRVYHYVSWIETIVWGKNKSEGYTYSKEVHPDSQLLVLSNSNTQRVLAP